MHKQNQQTIILALGLFSPTINGRRIDRGPEGIIAAARESFPDLVNQIVTIQSLTDFTDQFEWLGEGLENTRYRGLASGFYVQEALEGGHSITDIHFDLAGMDGVTMQSHSGSELRSLIAHIAAFFPRQVNIHFRSGAGLSTIPKDGEEVLGAELPEWIRKRLGI